MKNLPDNLLSMKDLSEEQIQYIFEACDKNYSHFRSENTWALMFLEPSTRTRASFEIAAKDLNSKYLLFEGSGSSLEKGETLRDTLENLKALGVTRFVIRQNKPGALGEFHIPGVRIINAGDGNREHPTQALLDAFTIQKTYGSARGKKLLIMGDVLNSRVAHSWMHLAPKIGVELYLSSPPSLAPREFDSHFRFVENPQDIIPDVDLVMTVRIQKERFSNKEDLEKQFLEIENRYQLKKSQLTPKHRFMAPGPVYWNSEIEEDLKDDPRSLVLKQVENGRILRRSLMRLFDS